MNLIDAYLGKTKKGREIMLEEAYTNSLRKGNWKYIRPLDAGREIPAWMANKDIENGLSKQAQLYDLSNDIGEQTNLADSNPALVKEFEAQLKVIENRTSIRK